MEYVLHLTTSILLAVALAACGGNQTPSATSGGGTKTGPGTPQEGGFGDASDGAGGGEVTPASEDVEVPPAP